jgi:hypothetical protein
MRRDGFGYLSVRRDGDALLTTIPLKLHAGTPQVTLNADGLSQDATLRVEILGRNGNPLPGYSATVVRSGLNEPAQWHREASALERGEYRLRLYFAGGERDHIHFYAAYIK